VYYLWDAIFVYPREPKEDLTSTTAKREAASLKFYGVMPNALLLLCVLLAVLFLDPGRSLFGWHPWAFFREFVMLALVFLSLTLGSKEARAANNFCYAAIIEVAALFFGIFLCMQAPLQIIHAYAPGWNINSAMQFFWISGPLASFLDNAPTYVVFFETAKSLPLSPEAAIEAIAISGVPICVRYLIAVSLASVFMGAMTYIGNGPNFMVKAIAENFGIKMPSFFGYMRYSCLVLLPILLAMSLIFLR
jgi:Na+/H+ antiporter NhaD/arsenite permease-like protein